MTKQAFQPEHIHKLQTEREVGRCVSSSRPCSARDRLSFIVNIKINIAGDEALLR